MLYQPASLGRPQHEGAAAEFVIPDVERDDRCAVELLDVDVLGVKLDPRRARIPNPGEHPGKGLPDRLLPV